MRHVPYGYKIENGMVGVDAEEAAMVRVMQKFLGHATIKETADTYTHVLDDLKQNEILKLDSVVNY